MLSEYSAQDIDNYPDALDTTDHLSVVSALMSAVVSRPGGTMKCLRRRREKIRDLIKRERHCLADPNYLSLIQKNRITPYMRSTTLDWVFELVDSTTTTTADHAGNHSVSTSLFPMVCCTLDRYLSVECVTPQELQDVALTAVLVCSRALGTPFTISSTLHNYIRLNKIMKIREQFVNAVRLQLDQVVLPTDYFPSYTAKIAEEYTIDVVEVVQEHAYNLLPVVYMEYESVLHPPSVIAGACVLESVTRLLGHEETLSTLHHIVTITNLHPSYLVKATKNLRIWIEKLLH